MKHTINATVENKPGVLARIIGVIAARGYNVETLNVAPSQDHDISRMTLTVSGEAHVLEQITKQLNKLIDIIKVNDLTGKSRIERELVLVEVGAPKGKRSSVAEIAALFKAEIVGVRENSLILQYMGPQDSIEDLLCLLKPFTIIALSRSGPIAVARGDN